MPIVFVVLRNGAYAILESFALLENTPGYPHSISWAWTSPPWQQVSDAGRPTSTPPKSWHESSRLRCKRTARP